MKTLGSWTVRLMARVALAIWFGGFTFYAAVVVPDLHEHLGGMETGEISRRVAVFLYAIGSAALLANGLVAVIDRGRMAGWRLKVRIGLLAVNSLLWMTLVGMHRSLGIQLDTGQSLSAFRSFHEVYLTVWTGQWLAILGLMASDLPERSSSGGARVAPPLGDRLL